MSVFLCTIREMENYNIKNGLIKMKKKQPKNQGLLGRTIQKISEGS